MGLKIFLVIIWTAAFILVTINVKNNDYKVDYINYVLLWICFMLSLIPSLIAAGANLNG